MTVSWQCCDYATVSQPEQDQDPETQAATWNSFNPETCHPWKAVYLNQICSFDFTMVLQTKLIIVGINV